jgi:cytochrome P450
VLQTIGGRHWPYAYLEYCQRKCGDPFTLYPLDMPPMVFMSHPDDVRAVLTGDPAALHPGAGGQVIEPLIGARSFMLLEEEDHVSGRKIVAPAFHRRMVKEQTEAMRAAVEQIVESWPAGSPVALQERIRHLTLVVILKVIFSDEPPVLPALHRSLMQMLGISDTLLLQGPRLRHLPGWRGR